MKLIVDNLVVVRGVRTVIDGLSFAVSSGDALVLTGANGAGKTTLIRTMAGLLRAESGRVHLEGGDPERSVGEQCHYVGHLTGTKSSLTVHGNVAFWATYLGAEPGGESAGARAHRALELVRLDQLAGIPAGFLSAGQRRRLGLARLFVAKRSLWLLDEPTVSLDSASAALLGKLIDAHVAAGGIVVAATHLPLGIAHARQLHLGPAEVAA